MAFYGPLALDSMKATHNLSGTIRSQLRLLMNGAWGSGQHKPADNAQPHRLWKVFHSHGNLGIIMPECWTCWNVLDFRWHPFHSQCLPVSYPCAGAPGHPWYSHTAMPFLSKLLFIFLLPIVDALAQSSLGVLCTRVKRKQKTKGQSSST